MVLKSGVFLVLWACASLAQDPIPPVPPVPGAPQVPKAPLPFRGDALKTGANDVVKQAQSQSQQGGNQVPSQPTTQGSSAPTSPTTPTTPAGTEFTCSICVENSRKPTFQVQPLLHLLKKFWIVKWVLVTHKDLNRKRFRKALNHHRRRRRVKTNHPPPNPNRSIPSRSRRFDLVKKPRQARISRPPQKRVKPLTKLTSNR